MLFLSTCSVQGIVVVLPGRMVAVLRYGPGVGGELVNVHSAKLEEHVDQVRSGEGELAGGVDLGQPVVKEAAQILVSYVAVQDVVDDKESEYTGGGKEDTVEGGEDEGGALGRPDGVGELVTELLGQELTQIGIFV